MANKRKNYWFEPQGNISKRSYTLISISCFVLFLAVWSLLTYSGIIDKLFLPTPTDIVVAGVQLFTEFNFIHDVGITIYRVFAGFLLAAIVGIPLGILIGTYKPVEAFFEPMVSFIRYMPASAFIPLFILWIGIGETEKITVIFVGSVFSIILMTAVEVSNVRKEYLEAAYTLGSTKWSVLKSVILPASLPGIMEINRLVLGWAWTYIVVAEMIAAESGIGHVILESQRMLRTENIIFGIITIGLIGLISDAVMKKIIHKTFRWNYGG